MKKETSIKIILALLVTGLLIPLGGGVPYRTPSFHSITRPYAFGLVNWSIKNTFDKGMCKIRGSDNYSDLSQEERLELVREYLHMGAEKGYLDFRLMELSNSDTSNKNNSELKSVKAQWQTIIGEMEQIENHTEAIIGHQLQDVLVKEHLCLLPDISFPPVMFEFEELPHLVIISPRDRIEMLDTLVLRPDLTSEEMTEIENRLEELGFSAIIERVGGIATYPSMVPQTSVPSLALSTIAHEWTHHYLFFHSLGRHYNASYDMRIINETVCDIVGDEISPRLMNIFYGERQEDNTETPPGAFDFNKEMHAVRLAVDEYLEKSEVEEAERFMEEKRQFIYQNGYYIRKINLAYFAWHGSYGGSPSSISPIGEQINELRERSSSLGEFLKLVDGISNPDDLQELLDSQ